MLTLDDSSPTWWSMSAYTGPDVTTAAIANALAQRNGDGILVLPTPVRWDALYVLYSPCQHLILGVNDSPVLSVKHRK